MMAKTKKLAAASKLTPVKREPEPLIDVGEAIKHVGDLLTELRRRYAAYERLSNCYAHCTLTAPPGSRPVGAPVFSFKASIDGVGMIDVAQDMREVDERYLPIVFGAFSQAQAKRLLLATESLSRISQQLHASVSAACASMFDGSPLTSTPPVFADDNAADEIDEEDDEEEDDEDDEHDDD